jgi:hypothetical protein
MGFSVRLASAALAMSAAFAAAAHGATLFTLAGPTSAVGIPGFIDETFSASAGPGTLSFTLDGFNTVDGANVSNNFEDDFTLSLNGVAIFAGSFDLGGGGQNIVSLQPAGSTVTLHASVFGRGGTVDISAPLDLAAGLNTLRFAYATAAPQAFTDESWAIQNLSVTGDAAAGGVPEPASWALMLAGFLGIGARLRRHRAGIFAPAA